jgi:mono/diheme cytochrome c family protein
MKNIMLYIFITILSLLSCNDNPKSENQNPKLQESIQRGEAVYSDLCITCHLPDGKGVPKIFPPLANSDYLKNKRAESIKAIKYGMSGEITVNGLKYNTPMAALGLTNKEVADVMNYITNSWGNKNDKIITEDEVSKIQR